MSGLMMINRSTMNYQSRRDPQHALRVRLQELAASRVRFGYRRLTVLLRREGWKVSANGTIGSTPRTGLRCEPGCARKSRRVAACRRSERPGRNEMRSTDFVAARLAYIICEIAAMRKAFLSS